MRRLNKTLINIHIFLLLSILLSLFNYFQISLRRLKEQVKAIKEFCGFKFHNRQNTDNCMMCDYVFKKKKKKNSILKLKFNTLCDVLNQLLWMGRE